MKKWKRRKRIIIPAREDLTIIRVWSVCRINFSRNTATIRKFYRDTRKQMIEYAKRQESAIIAYGGGIGFP